MLAAALSIVGQGCGSRTGLLPDSIDGGDVQTIASNGQTCVPEPEVCNGIDDNCDGVVDEGFNLGQACDGPDSDLCLDDVMTCSGCSRGPDNVEVCNGVDDDCNGIVDADCEVGHCSPSLTVTGSVPSSPSCIDFPVRASTTGNLDYPCGGGLLNATLGDISFEGSVSGGQVSLVGSAVISADQSPDGCVWVTRHEIDGDISSGELQYYYSEQIDGGRNCWFPCKETGTVKVHW